MSNRPTGCLDAVAAVLEKADRDLILPDIAAALRHRFDNRAIGTALSNLASTGRVKIIKLKPAVGIYRAAYRYTAIVKPDVWVRPRSKCLLQELWR